jgi:DNA-binding SARP family transcriptional activator
MNEQTLLRARGDPWRAATHVGNAVEPSEDAAGAPALPTAAMLTVRLLDGFQLWHGGEPLPTPPHGRVRTLFKVLLLQRRRPLPRARLCALLWPEAEAEKARNNLHVALHRLRRDLGGACAVRLDDAGYQLLPRGELWLDTEQFVAHAEAGRRAEAAGRRAEAVAQYEAALALYQSDLLHDEECEASLAADAQALRDGLSEVLERLSGLSEAEADWHGGLRTALRHLRLDPCNERAHRRLMTCYSRLGQLSLAEQQYRHCISQLRRDLGLGPSEETTQLYRRLAARLDA